MIGVTNEDPTKDVKFKENEKKKNDIIKMIDDYDSNMLKYIGRLYEAINGDKMDFDRIKNAVDALQQFNTKQEYNYLNNLLHPEKCKAVKIPSPVPVPSCSFQLHNCVTLSTNSSGNIGIIFNPFFLASSNALKTYDVAAGNGEEATTCTAQSFTTLFVNNADSLTGANNNIEWRPVNIGQVIPGVYDQYRLVSASLVVKYIGRLDIVSGVIGGAIIFDENPHIGGTYVQELAPAVDFDGSSFSKYGNFDLAMDSFYHQENLTLEGVRELYFPIDNSFEEYVRVTDGSHLSMVNGDNVSVTSDQDYYKSGFNWFVYALGAPANSACFKVDIYCNFECLPNASFLNYLPLTMNPMGVSSQEKRRANMIVQQKPVMKLNEEGVTKITTMPSIWEKLKNKFSNKLPGIGKLIANGIISMVPGLKSGLGIAGTLLEIGSQDQTMEEDVE